MTTRFKDDEAGYASWLNSNPHGYVFNHFGSSNAAFNVVHRATCSFVRRQKDEGRRTVVAKLCSVDLDELLSAVRGLRAKDGWKYCGICCGPERESRGVRSASALVLKEPAVRVRDIRSPRPHLLSPPAVKAQPGPCEGEFALWQPGEVLAAVEIEPQLASWDAKAHSSQIKLQAFLDQLQRGLAPFLHSRDPAPLCLQFDVVRPHGTDLLRHWDVENVLTPVAHRLRDDTIVLFSGAKRHQRSPENRSSVTIRRVEPGAVGNGFKFFSVRLVGSSEAWKPAIRQALIDSRIKPAAAGPVDMVIAIRQPSASRSEWWRSWKSIGDGLGPILGEPIPAKPYHPADGRIISLAFHRCPVGNAGAGTDVGIWWRTAADPA